MSLDTFLSSLKVVAHVTAHDPGTVGLAAIGTWHGGDGSALRPRRTLSG